MVASLKSCGGIQGLSCDIVRTARPLRTLRQSQCGLKQRFLNLMQIGELAKTSLSDAAKTAIPNIPWKQLYGVRNRIVHGYDDRLGYRIRRHPPASSVSKSYYREQWLVEKRRCSTKHTFFFLQGKLIHDFGPLTAHFTAFPRWCGHKFW